MSGDRRVRDRGVSAEVQVSRMPMRKVKMPVRASAEKRDQAEGESNHKTDQIEVRPRRW